MDFFEDYLKDSLVDWQNPKFEERTKVHDWRNYVPKEFEDGWSELTERERKIIAVMGQMQAEQEEWD